MTAGDRTRLAIAFLSLPIIALLLPSLGLKRTQAWLAHCSPHTLHPPTATQQQQAQHLAHLVRRAARYYGCTCLRQALIVWWLLRWQRVACELRLGVRRHESQLLAAHAWVECGAIALGEPDDPHHSYTPFLPHPSDG
ncbi:MAG: lasso peptide biosynthesis B2 protein [Spirulinaceae cyanobacterium SM2_1_0]|nr:lasso peptide biosynthesis B2 protein [Spirulinaceae cyanobacterium SM2_1_0]